VFPGVAEAAASGTAASSLADLFCQMLATAQAGIAATAEDAAPQDACTEGACDGTDAASAESIDAAAVLASALTAAPALSANAEGLTEEVPAASVAPVVVAATAEDALLAETAAAVEAMKLGDRVVVPEVQPTDPAATLAMQVAAARTGLGPDGAMTTRRFGDVAVTFARPVQAVEPAPGEGAAPLRELAQPSAKAGQTDAESSEAGNEAEGSLAELLKPSANASTPKSGEATAFDMKPMSFGASEVHGVSRGRAEPLMQAAQANVPQTVSVRDVGDVIVRSVHYHSGRTEDVVTVRLVPQSLGELRIAVHSGERGVEVVLTAANNAARDALETNLTSLREALGREGMNVERVSVQVFAPFDAGHQPGSSQQHQQGGAGQSARQPNTAYRESSGSPPQQQGNSEQQARRQQHAGRLNMWV